MYFFYTNLDMVLEPIVFFEFQQMFANDTNIGFKIKLKCLIFHQDQLRYQVKMQA